MRANLDYLQKNFKEVSKEEVLRFKPGKTYMVYNPLTDSSKEEVASPIDIVHNKHCYEKLRYFVKGE